MADSDSSERSKRTKTPTTGNRTMVAQQPGIQRGNMNGSPYNGYPPLSSPYGPQYGPYSPNPMMYQQPGMSYGGQPMRNPRVFMPPPQLIPGVPRGLEYLASVDGIVVNQLIEWLEVFTGIETRNRYSLCNNEGQQVYFAYEQSSFAARMIAGKNRAFSMLITDNFMQPVILVHRPYTYCAGFSCFGYNGCCKDECLVECPPGNQIGRIVQKNSFCKLEYFVEDMSGEEMFLISGPVCTCVCADHEWPIYNAKNMAQIGSITKEWGGLAKEMYTDAGTFNVGFPIGLNVHLKALLIGATFLIDFMKYENNQQGGGQHNRGMYY